MNKQSLLLAWLFESISALWSEAASVGGFPQVDKVSYFAFKICVVEHCGRSLSRLQLIRFEINSFLIVVSRANETIWDDELTVDDLVGDSSDRLTHIAGHLFSALLQGYMWVKVFEDFLGGVVGDLYGIHLQFK